MHSTVSTPRGNLSRSLRHLNGVYTQRYNRLHHTDGPLFRGRFKAIVVDADTYLAQLSRYIHLNPMLAKMPDKAFDSRWSSYPAYLGRVQPPEWLHLQPTLGLFDPRDARRRYQAFVESGLDEDLRAFYAKKRLEPILGGETFRARMAQLLRGKPVDADIPDAKRMTTRPTLERIVQVTAAHFGVHPDDLSRDGRGRGNPARTVAMALSRSPGGYSLKEIAQVFGVAASSSISVAARRLRERLQKNRVLRKEGLSRLRHSFSRVDSQTVLETLCNLLEGRDGTRGRQGPA